MKMKHFLSSAACIALIIFAASCSTDVPATDSAAEGKKTTIFSGSAGTTESGDNMGEGRVVLADTLTRSSLLRKERSDAGSFLWEAGDYIYVKDDNQKWNKSNEVDSQTANYDFNLATGSYSGGNTIIYNLTATDQNKPDQVTIANTQTQSEFNKTEHIGKAGDCAIATAQKSGSGFSFNLQRKVAFLCFLPSADESICNKYKITKVTVKSNANLAGRYTLSDQGLTNPTDPSTTITLNAGAAGFDLTGCTTADIKKSLYMVVAPGTHTLSVEYTIVNNTTNAETIVTQTINKQTTISANKVYNVAYKLSVQREQSDNMVTWDKIAKGIPNVNTAYWLAECGDAYWDANHKVTVNGKEYTGGLWLKKISKIASDYNTSEEEMKNHTKGGINMDTDSNRKYTFSYKIGTPTNTNDYFFLPACGGAYNNGWGTEYNIEEGKGGSYWLSSQGAYASDNQAWVLFFKDGGVGLIHNPITSMSFGKTNLFQ